MMAPSFKRAEKLLLVKLFLSEKDESFPSAVSRGDGQGSCLEP